MEESGQVFISVKEGKSLGITEPTDVYCIIQLEQQKVRTSLSSRVVPGGRAEWSEGYTFDVTTDADISIKVWGKSASAPRGRLLGSLTIRTSTAKGRPPVETWQPLTPPPQTPPPCGELFYRTSYINSTSKVGYEDFTILKLIGKGAFGKVMLVRKNDTGRLYAMKQLDKDHVLSLAAVTFTLTERNVLKTFNHPFVVSLKYSFQTKSSLFMVLDYVGGGELFYHMAERGVFDEDTVRFYAAQIVLALGFLHDHGVTYRDLKPENLLLDIHGNICLCDFGLCKEQVDGESTFTLCGSPEYMAPEVLQGKGYGRSVDWWALGILIYEMLTGLPPFYSEDPVEMGQNILTAPIHFPDHLSKNIMGLIVQLLRRDPSRRLGSGPNDAEDIKAHPFFAHVDWKKILRKEIEPPFKPHLNGSMDLTYFDPNCTEIPVNSIDREIRASPASSDPEDCFAQFSFVAPSDFGSTPHQLRKTAPSPAPLSFSHIGALHSSSPVFSTSHNSHHLAQPVGSSHSSSSSSSSHTPTQPNHLMGGGIPRSQGNFTLSNYSSSFSSSQSPQSSLTIIASSSPRNSFTMEDADRGGVVMTRRMSDENSPPVQFSARNTQISNSPHIHHPLHSSQPLPSNNARSFHPVVQQQQQQGFAPYPPRDPAHPLRDLLPPSHPPDIDDKFDQIMEDAPWSAPLVHPPPLHSLSSPTIINSQPQIAQAPTPESSKSRQLRFPLSSSASSPDLMRLREEEGERKEKEEKKKGVDGNGKKFTGFMSLFRKIK